MPEQAVSTIVAEPLSPELLLQLGLLSSFPAPPVGFDPDAGWIHNYRIATCHGYLDRGNRNVGFLQLERIAGGQKTFTLRLLQRILNDEGAVHTLQGEMHCERDASASLLGWRLTSFFHDRNGAAIAGLGAKESGNIVNGVLTTMLGMQVSKKDLARRLSADWSLFEAVQRLPFGPVVAPPFDLLEGLRLLREEHRCVYRGRYHWKGSPAPLHWFHQIGSGLLPYEYWLDERHRLLLVATHARAYILDEEAEAVFERIRKQLQDPLSRRSDA